MARTTRFIKLITALAACAGLTIGCGNQNSPVTANNEPTITHDEEGRTYITLSSEATRTAAKIASSDDGRSVTKVFDEDGGKFKIDEEGDENTDLDDLEIQFRIPDNALDGDVEITMTVYGYTLETLVIAFEPAGLIFNIPAELEIEIGHDLCAADEDEAEEMFGQHQYADGSVDEIDAELLKKNQEYEFYLQVPGFSRYSMGGGYKVITTANGRYSPGGGY